MTIHDTSFLKATLASQSSAIQGGSSVFWATKRAFDLTMAAVLLPLLIVFSILLFVLNPVLNPGPVFFVQVRMGKNCRAFGAYKFRTMRQANNIARGPHDPIEMDRIPWMGHILRKTRIDELPQILNVLLGQMSMIGPRPDYFPHARAYVREISGYRYRHQIRPGISGLAQVDVGYAVTADTVRKKVEKDLIYIRNVGFKMEVALVLKTLRTVLKGLGM